jgi:hypothetical protein
MKMNQKDLINEDAAYLYFTNGKVKKAAASMDTEGEEYYIYFSPEALEPNHPKNTCWVVYFPPGEDLPLVAISSGFNDETTGLLWKAVFTNELDAQEYCKLLVKRQVESWL